MARLMTRCLARLAPRTQFGRLALLLFVVILASHALAMTLMLQLGPEMFGPGPESAPTWYEGDFDEMDPPLFDAPPPGPDRPPALPFFHPGFWLDISIRLAALMLAAWIGARWLSRPMLRLASAARELGNDIRRPPLTESGTDEYRQTTRVFNQMQAQICRQLAERDRFVAAVSHDLRTPLTRLALRAESLPDAEDRRRFGRDIGEMEAMITATLDYLRGAADPEPFVLLDLVSLLHSVADDHLASGHAVRVVDADTCTACAPLRTQASSLRRCISNLVDNAVRHGGNADIRCRDAADHVCIEISDRGPGIPETELEKIRLPFYRAESSRRRNSQGMGLGLSIASDIVRQLKGQLHMRNDAAGGLVVTVTLPR